MFNKALFSIALLVVFSLQCNAQSRDNLLDINSVWLKFYKAYDDLDYTLMEQIHSKDLVRVSGGTIKDYDTYINNYKSMFDKAKENKQSYKIFLRFFERLNNDSIASERGIYKLMVNPDSKDRKAYYGQFHVLFKKENGAWKLVMDYDSNESNTIDSKDYNKAYGMSEIRKFAKN